MSDFHTNFAYSTVATAPSPANSGTSLIVQTGDGVEFPLTPFNATVWPTGAQPTAANAEIVRVTDVTGDTFTIIRTQESTSARSILVGDQIAATITAKTLTDIEGAIPGVATVLTYQNRQLGASTQSAPGQNSLWLTPFRIPANNYVSMSTLLLMQSFTGSVTSNQTNTVGLTLRWGIFSNNTTNSSRLDSWISGSITWQIWNSGTASVSYAYSGNTSSSAGSSLTSLFYGLRMHQIPINSSVPPGFYAMAYALSTSSAGNSSVLRTAGMVMDNPVTVNMGFIGAGTNASIGYGDAGKYSATTGAIPSSIGLSQIKQTRNIVPYFKMGAI